MNGHLESDAAATETTKLDNRVFVLREKGHFYYENRPVPTPSSDKHVVVTIEATGLCGSDVSFFQHWLNRLPDVPLNLLTVIQYRSTTGATVRSATSRSVNP